MSNDPYPTPDKSAPARPRERGIPGVDVPVAPTAGSPALPATNAPGGKAAAANKTAPDAKTDKKPVAKPQSAVHFTRAAALWSALIVGLLILTVLLVFITQNTESVEVTFIAWHWQLPLGVQILLAAVLGALVTVMAGTVRIYQLRRAAKKNLKAGLV
jgi:uncharacterized integral membrane protein